MFARILCATDLSPRSDEALRVAVHLAAKYDSPLTVLNAHEEFLDKDEMLMLRVSAERMQERFREIALKARQQMQKMVTMIGIEEVQVNYLIREGRPGEVILDVSRELQIGLATHESVLIVMGVNGKDTLKERILGSVAEHVVRHAQCPVLVIPYFLDK
jgi:nucleotide-binding universal stress UspA family protein